MTYISSITLGAVVIIVALLVNAVKVVREYERLVVYFLGRYQGIKNPGLRLIIPGIQQFFRVDVRVRVLDVPPQDVISRDNVTVKVNAVVYFQVVDAQLAMNQVEHFMMATSQLAQTTLRSVLGQHELDEMIAARERLNQDIRQILDEQTGSWGIKVTNVEIKNVDLNENMIRAIARQSEAERERRAKIISAEGELQSSQKLLEAAQVLSQRPEAMQLRYLQTLITIASEHNSTIIFPLPVELLSAYLGDKGVRASKEP